MALWRVTIPETEYEVEADSEFGAMLKADLEFDMFSEAFAEQIDGEEE